MYMYPIYTILWILTKSYLRLIFSFSLFEGFVYYIVSREEIQTYQYDWNTILSIFASKGTKNLIYLNTNH